MFLKWQHFITVLLSCSRRGGSGPQDVDGVLSPLVWVFRDCVDRAANSSEYDRRHATRYTHTFMFLVHLYPVVKLPLRVLELGGGGGKDSISYGKDDSPLFGRCLREALGGPQQVILDTYARDLRRPFVGVQEATYDLVICLEVIEHVHDLWPADQGDLESFPDLFLYTGMRTMLGEVRRVLKPGAGRLLLTTPNAGSLHVFGRLIKHQAPWWFAGHQRELSVSDLGNLLLQCGLAGDPVFHDAESFRDLDSMNPEQAAIDKSLIDFLRDVAPGVERLRKSTLMVITKTSEPYMLATGETVTQADLASGQHGLWAMLLGYEMAKRLLPEEFLQLL
eukprot:TRINITY_DN73475_c0_g1_i1.p1 TRINITY_DN73475_c0_g1~~TRINITY_DN73475_c0_g1_i1.p1  ORF type:complete len:335 (-),score=20.76 TRINITY_DN73475_c0_g1_i1:157-1161(-)